MSPDAIRRSAEAVRRRARLRAWELRRQRHALGTWDQLRRTLAHASHAWAADADAAAALVAEGWPAEPVGQALQPLKAIFFVPLERARELAARPIPVRLGAELLQARTLVLVRFESGADPGSAGEAR